MSRTDRPVRRPHGAQGSREIHTVHNLLHNRSRACWPSLVGKSCACSWWGTVVDLIQFVIKKGQDRQGKLREQRDSTDHWPESLPP